MQPSHNIIAAIATASGRGGIGIVRLSGRNISSLILAIIGKTLEPRIATFSNFHDSFGETIDHGIAIFFPAPHSYTGEDVLELQGHGGIAVLQLVLHRCLELGACLAQPGEFTQRAYLNGKLDLAQAESVADLIEATTTQAAQSAIRSLQGEFSKATQHVIDGLVQLRMLVEAMLDFPEEDIDTADVDKRQFQLNNLCKELDLIQSLAKQGSLLREGAHIVLVGQPNVGKSSLLNRLSGDDIALVSEIPGTTRDVIRQSIQISGVPFHIIDTAGIRDSHDAVELMGIARTHSTIKSADAILVLIDAKSYITIADQKILDELPQDIPRLLVCNKIDLLSKEPSIDDLSGLTHIYLSAKDGTGIQLLRDKLLSIVGWQQEAGVYMARERHLKALQAAKEILIRSTNNGGIPELLAEDLRLAQEQLISISGEFTSDDLLGEIFSRFCIGK